MSKRYTFTRPYNDAYEIVDRDIDKALNPEDVADLLNQQQERITELEEQLKNAIVPKFKVGYKCWAVRNATNIYTEPKQVLIKEILITKNCIKYYAKNGCLTNRTNKTTMHLQTQLFATKEEALAKLKELSSINGQNE